MARTYQNVAMMRISLSETAIGESLAFNQTIGDAGEYLVPGSKMDRYLSFYRKNRDLYIGTKDLASVAVFRSYPSITYHNSRAGLSAILVEQALIQAKVPFHLIFDEQLSNPSPAMCKVLILPNSECLSDDQLSSIRRYFEADGGLVATEQADLYDSWRRLRVKPALQGLVDGQASGSAYQEEVPNSLVVAGAPVRKESGRGRAVYFPGIEFDGPLPPSEPHFHIGIVFWKSPKSWKELVDAVSWAAQGDIPLQVLGPDFLAANLVEQSEKRRRFVHLVNYNTKETPTSKDIELKCAVPEGESASTVRLYSADSDTYSALNSGCKVDRRCLQFPNSTLTAWLQSAGSLLKDLSARIPVASPIHEETHG
jgi:hypothetical protein